MGYVPLEDLLGKTVDTSSLYKLVIMAAKRGLEIAEGQPKLVDVSSALKPSTIALHEIAAHMVSYKRLKKD